MLNKDFFIEGQPSALALFDLPPTQTGVENIKMENIQPTSTISENSPILFDISDQNGMEYLDLMRSRIYVKLRVKHKDGTKLAPKEDVAPVNLFLVLIFPGRCKHSRKGLVINFRVLSIQSLYSDSYYVMDPMQKCRN